MVIDEDKRLMQNTTENVGIAKYEWETTDKFFSYGTLRSRNVFLQIR